RALQPSYPRPFWERVLATYESAELDRVIRDASSNATADDRKQGMVHILAADLNDAMRAQQPALPKVVVEGGCGAGEMPVKIATDPKGAQVLFIPSFFYE